MLKKLEFNEQGISYANVAIYILLVGICTGKCPNMRIGKCTRYNGVSCL
jgi:hypothetical protein